MVTVCIYRHHQISSCLLLLLLIVYSFYLFSLHFFYYQLTYHWRYASILYTLCSSHRPFCLVFFVACYQIYTLLIYWFIYRHTVYMYVYCVFMFYFPVDTSTLRLFLRFSPNSPLISLRCPNIFFLSRFRVYFWLLLPSFCISAYKALSKFRVVVIVIRCHAKLSNEKYDLLAIDYDAFPVSQSFSQSVSHIFCIYLYLKILSRFCNITNVK